MFIVCTYTSALYIHAQMYRYIHIQTHIYIHIKTEKGEFTTWGG